MGHSTLLDIIGSTMISGFLFLMAFRLNASAVETSSAYYANALLQSNLTTMIVLVEDDFKRVGYCQNAANLPNTAAAIVEATDTTFAYKTDIGNTGAVDIIRYSVGPTSELMSTTNPRDRLFYRTVNGVTSKWNLGVTNFKFRFYWNAALTSRNEEPMVFPITGTDLNNIGFLDLSIQLESPFAMRQQYIQDSTSQYQIFWRQMRITSKNRNYR